MKGEIGIAVSRHPQTATQSRARESDTTHGGLDACETRASVLVSPTMIIASDEMHLCEDQRGEGGFSISCRPHFDISQSRREFTHESTDNPPVALPLERRSLCGVQAHHPLNLRRNGGSLGAASRGGMELQRMSSEGG